jgi:hypothetical protein
VDEIPTPVVVDQILQKRVIMKEAWIVSESPCTELEHRTEAQPSHQKKSTEVDESSGGEEISDMSYVNYEPVDADYEPVDDNEHAQNDDNNRAEFAQFLLWRQNGRPAAKTTSKKSKNKPRQKPATKPAAARNTSKVGSKKSPNALSECVLSGSDDDGRFM